MTGPIHCANCGHCKTFLRPVAGGELGEKRVRCQKGRWLSDNGKARTYSYRFVLNRVVEGCDDYDSMGDRDREEFLTDLTFNLPDQRELVPLTRRIAS